MGHVDCTYYVAVVWISWQRLVGFGVGLHVYTLRLTSRLCLICVAISNWGHPVPASLLQTAAIVVSTSVAYFSNVARAVTLLHLPLSWFVRKQVCVIFMAGST